MGIILKSGKSDFLFFLSFFFLSNYNREIWSWSKPATEIMTPKDSSKVRVNKTGKAVVYP